MLTDSRREHLWEGFWAMVAAAVAVLRSAGEALFEAYWKNPAVPLDLPRLIDVMILVASFSVAFALAIIIIGRGRDQSRGTGLLAEIRARTAEETRHRRD
jgi:hypothetical protein